MRVEFLLHQPLPLDTASTMEQLRLTSLEERQLNLPPVPAGFMLPPGFDPVVEVTAQTSTGLTTVRRGKVTAPLSGL